MNGVKKARVEGARPQCGSVKIVRRTLIVPVDLYAHIVVLAERRSLTVEECAVCLLAKAVRDKKFLPCKVPTPQGPGPKGMSIMGRRLVFFSPKRCGHLVV